MSLLCKNLRATPHFKSGLASGPHLALGETSIRGLVLKERSPSPALWNPPFETSSLQRPTRLHCFPLGGEHVFPPRART